MEFITDYRTEKYVLETQWDDIPADIKEHVLMCGIDLMTALIIGSGGSQFRAGEKLAASLGFGGNVPVVGSEKTYSMIGATSVMAHSSNSFDIDDGHREICGHPGTSFVPGALAAALEKDICWKDYLTTLFVCYELSIRWALAMQDHYGYLHSTGAYGSFGTAAAIGRICGLSKEQLNNALSIADFHAPMTPVMRSVEYPSMNKDGVPFGALIGAMAVMETIAGSTGKGHILEMPEYKEHLDDLGSRFRITELYFKPYTCCRWAHQPVLACTRLMKEHGIKAEDIKNVKVYTFESAARLSKIRPSATDEAQYNIAWPVAASIVYGDVGFKQVCDEALSDVGVMAMMDRLEFMVDPILDAEFPDKRLARVEMTLGDGRMYMTEAVEAPGEPDDSELGLAWVDEKFRRITSPFIAPDDQGRLLTTMEEELDVPVKEIVSLINKSLS